MEPRAAAHALAEIATLLELRGESSFKVRAYRNAARALQSITVPDIAPLLASGELAKVPGLGPATLRVVEQLVRQGDSEYLELLRETTPEGLLDMLRVPGLGTSKINQIHAGLGIETLQELETAARDGRLQSLPRFGPKTVQRILRGIALLRESGAQTLFPHALGEGLRILAALRANPNVIRAELAGSIRRHREVIGDIDIVAACRTSPEDVAASFARGRHVRDVVGTGSGNLRILFRDGTRVDLYCTSPERFTVTLWRATGSENHCAEALDAARRAEARAVEMVRDMIVDAYGVPIPVEDEHALYAALGMSYVPPELREGLGEIEAASAGTLPRLVQRADIRGVLHCHSQYSDGSTTIAQLADAAVQRGWSYVGITDHSQSAFYAGGISRDDVLRQHDEIDELNARRSDIRILKGIEADILGDGRVDFSEDLLDHFDYVVASVHSRFGMTQEQMTERVLRALDDPCVTILGHPTGRLLLTREPYAIDIDAVIEKASEVGVAIELNADPHRLDLDWRFLRNARDRGAMVEIGPDAHSVPGLDNITYGIGIARKGWLEPANILNCQSVDDVLAFARVRRDGTLVSATSRQVR